MKLSQAFNEAKSLLFERGWGQVVLESEGALCLEGACAIPLFGQVSYLGSYSPDPVVGLAARNILIDAIGLGERAPWEYNDDTGRTFSDIVDVLDRAEKLALISEEGG